MVTKIALGDIPIEVVKKDIKNVHLSVYPPSGRVRISAPLRMNLDTIRVFAISKLPWIKQQQKKLRKQERETPREYLDRESHYVWGRRYLLDVVESEGAQRIELKHSKMLLHVRPRVSHSKKKDILEEWYRAQLRGAAPALMAKWESRLEVKAKRLFVQRMRTKWGSCNAEARSIRLNTELAKKPLECLEYILVHELVHLVVRHHNERFHSLMDEYLPGWKTIRQTLNEAPLGHTDWDY